MTESFHSIISNICQQTILTIPNKDDKFVVSCDASSCGVGSVLSVVREDGESPVAFNYYDFNIVYRPGQDNHVPDALSRQGWDP